MKNELTNQKEKLQEAQTLQISAEKERDQMAVALSGANGAPSSTGVGCGKTATWS